MKFVTCQEGCGVSVAGPDTFVRLGEAIAGSATRTAMEGPSQSAWLCGRHVADGLDSFAALGELERCVFFSYRRGFARIEGNLRLSSDVGWGCSHRSGQMLLCCALVRLRLGREWSPATPTARETLCDVVASFADLASAPFSIHALTVAATRLTDKRLGDWLGPSSVSVCLRAVVNARQPGGLRCYLAQDGAVIYRGALPRNGPVLILCPLRLGLDGINPSYIPLLKLVLQCPLCVGIVGGRESSSFYFLGYEGDNVLLLDPHTVQPAFERTDRPMDLESFRASPVRMPFAAIDPSVSVGFVLTSVAQLGELETFLREQTSHLPYTITVEDGTGGVDPPPVVAAPKNDVADDWLLI